MPRRIPDRSRPRREAAHASAGGDGRSPGTGGTPMRISPDELVFWRYGFLVLNSTIVTTWALMLVMAVGAKLVTRKLDDRRGHLALARLPGDRGHVDPGADQGGGPRAIRRSISASSAPCSCSSRSPTSARSCPGTSRRPVRSRRPRRWRSACSSPCPSSASRSKAWAVTSSPTCSRRSSCCRSTSSASFLARWPWPSACSAT